LLLLVISQMSDNYGMVIKSKKYGINLLNTSDRVGRIVGWHDITPIPLMTKKTFSYDHSDLNKYGEVFAWFGTSFMRGLAGDVILNINNGVIILELDNVYRNGLIDIYDDIIRLYYGVY
ncbi:hypothetical protein ACK3PU_003054, partial [Proteus mirabilis]